MERNQSLTDVTAQIARWVAGKHSEPFSASAMTRARHAFLDWLGVTLAAAKDPLIERLIADALANGERATAGIVGREEQLTPAFAALVNGAMSHALDYDDINKRMRGHPSVAIVPAILAAAGSRSVTLGELLEALSTGVEVACILGEMVGDAHYNQGFHTTGTVGTVAAAAGVSRLMGLTSEQCETALGLAATQAAGLRAMFGSMGKPLHAGKAAMNGLLAARWAKLGVTATRGSLEQKQGFGPTLSPAFNARSIRVNGDAPFGIEGNIFKYHAACFYTHSAMEALASLVEANQIECSSIRSIEVGLLPQLHSVCDILTPRTGLEIKFSIRHLLAMTLGAIDTADPESYTDACASDENLCALRAHISVVCEDFDSRTASRVTVRVSDATSHSLTLDVGAPIGCLIDQEARLLKKFRSLATTSLGGELVRRVSDQVLNADPGDTLNGLMSMFYRRDSDK